MTFADAFKADRGITKMFLAGDFNAYSEEDPIQVLEAAGLHATSSPTPTGEETYSFGGLSGSLDHVFANDGGASRRHRRRHLGHQRQRVDRLRVQPLQLQRHRLLRRRPRSRPPTTTRRSSASTRRDPTTRTPTTSRSSAPTTSTAGSSTTRQRRRPVPPCSPVRSSSCVRQNPDTVFAAAGDLIGASTFESFIQHDKPTIDALNEAGLEVSAVGNHEFDQGYDDLVNRVMAPYDATTNPDGGAELAVHRAPTSASKADDTARPAADDLDQGLRRRQGRLRRRGHRGPARAGRPGGIADIKVTDIVDAANAAADDLKADGADVVVLLVHEGAPSTDCAAMATDPTPTSARSSTASTPTSTRSSPATPTSPTTTRSRSPGGPGRAGHRASGGLGRPVRRQPQPARVHRRPDHG